MPFTLSPLTSAGSATLVFATALLVALAIDRYLGEPATRYHPVVWMGNYLSWAGRQLQRVARQERAFTQQASADQAQDFKAFWLAAFIWCVGAATIYIASGLLQTYLMTLPDVLGPLAGGALAALLLGAALKTLLAWAMLKNEVLAVENALNPAQGGSLADGRARLRWLVSRDVAHLTDTQVRESAIETLAENLNDSVVAPIFWFVLLGLPGAALYRFANTADAMWGYRGIYKGQNWAWAGKWAARADDLLSWIPARITGVLLAVVSRGVTWKTLRLEARRTASPNSGWPMAAMALALGVSLQKPGVYVLNAAGRAPLAQDTQRAIVYASKVLLVLVSVMQIAFALIALNSVA